MQAVETRCNGGGGGSSIRWSRWDDEGEWGSKPGVSGAQAAKVQPLESMVARERATVGGHIYAGAGAVAKGCCCYHCTVRWS
jgi:hypothetical protein